MPRTNLTALAALGKRTDVYAAGAADLTMTAADTGNKNQTAHTGKVMLLAHNTSADTAYTVTIDHTGDGDITAYSIGAAEFAVFGPFDLDGWCQTDMRLYFEASNAAVLLGVVDLSNH